ncbi:twin transmembrane helix small protein [Chitinimonas taiwanensis]|uniref:Twin transmembrane helix small protein n=1 Tax=Chitinimonas taiwanensis DSM 18899 TaxID=1121279 RepID=A0A1K2HGI8_9NEIS|nr:twin transmembrane helix small protein [Chitinimonas taiwanensis]SFZ75641.1 Protein of unknown function [Chitinimonas taiwanensis DSM 18899]
MKIIIVLLIIGILAALGSALFALIKHKGSSEKTVKALTLRVALSLGLFLLLMLAAKLGYIRPHGVY